LMSVWFGAGKRFGPSGGRPFARARAWKGRDEE
jgi:hypothetical protein